MKKLAFLAAAAAAVTVAAPAQAATVLYTSGTEVGLVARDGVYSGAFEAVVVEDAAFNPNFTADFTFTTPTSGNAIASAISIALNAMSNLNFSSIAINGVTGSVSNGTVDTAVTSAVLVPGGVNTLRITGLLNPNSGQGNAGFGGNVSFAAVPEPTTWALFILGFGMLGYGLRRRNAEVRATKARLTFA